MIQRAGVAPILRVPALSPILRCPDKRCRRTFEHAKIDGRYRGALRCVRTSCRTTWFAEPLEAGSVRRQLEDSFCDSIIANDLMARLRLPESIDCPMFLQIPLTLELWLGYNKDPDSKNGGARRLLRRALSGVARR